MMTLIVNKILYIRIQKKIVNIQNAQYDYCTIRRKTVNGCFKCTLIKNLHVIVLSLWCVTEPTTEWSFNWHSTLVAKPASETLKYNKQFNRILDSKYQTKHSKYRIGYRRHICEIFQLGWVTFIEGSKTSVWTKYRCINCIQ